MWVIGDLFQQYATKYLGIGRGIPLSNTNQLWGLAWGALVFGELTHADPTHRVLVIAGSLVMIAGALAVSSAVATERETASTHAAIERECERYGLEREARDRRIQWHPSERRSPRVVGLAHPGLRRRSVCRAGRERAPVPELAMNYAWTLGLTVG